MATTPRGICQRLSAHPERCIAVAILVAVLSIAGFGQTESVSTVERQAPQRLLLLFDGRVIIGDISEVAGGYSVERSEGSIVVPFDFVRLTATSIHEAYEKQRDSLQNPNAEQHLNLARWCFQHRLREQAVLELQSALELEPFRREARELLQLIEAVDAGETPRPTADPRADSGAPVALTSGGITSEHHLQFVSQVQPLLVNKCGNATCHGSASTNGLTLHNVRTGRRHQRSLSDKNLAMVLSFIDSDFPLHSPLLQKPREETSTVHRGVFAGALGARQVELLNDWIHDVAVDRQLARDYSGMPLPNDSGQVIEQTGVELEQSTGPRIIEIPRTATDRASPRSSEFLSDILDQEQPDAFDPDEFNRRMHGREQ